MSALNTSDYDESNCHAGCVAYRKGTCDKAQFVQLSPLAKPRREFTDRDMEMMAGEHVWSRVRMHAGSLHVAAEEAANNGIDPQVAIRAKVEELLKHK